MEVPMIIQRLSPLKLSEIETALRNAAQHRGATVSGSEPLKAASVFTIVHPALYDKLLSAEIRFALFLPCRIVVLEQGDGSQLTAVSPVQVARDFHHIEVAAAVAALEHLLIDILEELELAGKHIEFGLGATEDQMDVRGTVAQRIDSHGSKIEDLAGTGEQDSPGG